MAVDAHGAFVRERPVSLLSCGIDINHKENVMEEPKEEDEKKVTEVYLLCIGAPVIPVFSLSVVVYGCAEEDNQQLRVKNFSFHILQLL